MKNIYNFNIEVVTPKKTPKEQKLFEKWKPILRRSIISDELIEQYKNDLLTLKTKPMKPIAFLLLFTSICFSQTYVKAVKLSSVLTTTVASNPSIYKQNIFELKECQNNDDALAKGLKVGMFYCLPMKDNISLIAVVRPPVLETKGTIENQTIYLSKEK